MEPEALKTEVGALGDKLVEKFGGHYHWEDNKVYYAYSGVKACVTCGDSDVQVDVELGMMMSFMKGKIKSEVETYLSKHIS
jgi:putative polyhydroxyalkanoate system protein